MKRVLGKYLVILLTLYAAATLSPKVQIASLSSALLFALILLLVNLVIKPIVTFLSLPITLLTLGLFLLVINTWMVGITDYLVKGVYIDGFLMELAIAIVISILNALLTSDSKD